MHSSRSQPLSAISAHGKISLLCLILLMLAGCSSRPLNQVAPETVRAELEIEQTQDQVNVAVTLRSPGQRAWLKPEGAELSITDAHGQRLSPQAPQRNGASRFTLDPNQGPFTLHVLAIIQQPIPVLDTPQVQIIAPAETPWQINDVVQLQVDPSTDAALAAQWILRCGSEQWRFAANLTPQQTNIELNLGQLWQQFEQTVGARITGIAELDLEVFYEPQIDTVSAVRIVEWRQLWRQQSQLQSPRTGAQLSGAIRLGTPNLSLGIQSVPVKACR